MNYYPHHIGDFNSATRHLTRIERSVYRDVIELYYDTEAPLCGDVDKLCRLLIARSDEEQAAVVQVLSEFFVDTDQGWRHAQQRRGNPGLCVVPQWHVRRRRASAQSDH